MKLDRRRVLAGLGGLGLGMGGLSWRGRQDGEAGRVAGGLAPAVGPVAPFLSGVQALRADFCRGVSYVHLHVPGAGYGSDRSAAELRELAQLGVREVVLMPFAYMPGLNRPTVRFGGDRTLSADALLAEAKTAIALGLSVVIKPHLWAREFGAGKFPGDIDMASPADWQTWFGQYTDYAVAMAEVAEAAGAKLFCVGTECTRASLDNPGAWAGVAAAVRRVYRGPLTYGANWHDEVFGFHDWSAFDRVGVNAYFPLSDAASPDLEQLLDGWRSPVSQLSGLARDTGRTILFTEAGYEAVAGAATRPWSAGEGPADPALQARAYEALFRALVPQPWFGGVCWWKWFTGGGDNPHDQSLFFPEAEARACLARWYRGA